MRTKANKALIESRKNLRRSMQVRLRKIDRRVQNKWLSTRMSSQGGDDKEMMKIFVKEWCFLST